MDLLTQLLERIPSGDGFHIADTLPVTVSRFRDRVFLLSVEILNFLGDRRAHQPKDVSSTALAQYNQETVAEYQEQFQSRVEETRIGLHESGLTDRRLTIPAGQVRSADDIHAVADALRELGQALPKPAPVKP
jgi:hypothetical protein